MNIKNILKAIKLNESTVSMVLGALVIIVVGVLVVNYFKDQEKVGLLPEVTSENQIENAEVGKTYTVSSGDNLWEIAENAYGSGYNWVDIAKENDLKSPDLLNEGQELSIPDVEPKLATVTSIMDESSPDKISGATYEVQKGDNLWDISVRAYGDGFKWVELAKVNNLSNPDLIFSGNILVLPR
ncbi:MAG: LysM peptidoglycan-binding domain-containing protein [Patescibacteria group bacterium]